MQRPVTDMDWAVPGCLVLAYRSQYWYWEMGNIARKFLLIMVIDFFHGPTLRFAQLNVALVILFVFLVIQVFIAPYEFNWCNRLAFSWMSVSIFTLFSAVRCRAAGLVSWRALTCCPCLCRSCSCRKACQPMRKGHTPAS